MDWAGKIKEIFFSTFKLIEKQLFCLLSVSLVKRTIIWVTFSSDFWPLVNLGKLEVSFFFSSKFLIILAKSFENWPVFPWKTESWPFSSKFSMFFKLYFSKKFGEFDQFWVISSKSKSTFFCQDKPLKFEKNKNHQNYRSFDERQEGKSKFEKANLKKKWKIGQKWSNSPNFLLKYLEKHWKFWWKSTNFPFFKEK